MDDADAHLDCQFRFLQPDEGHVLSEAIRVAYGESYDVRWVYDERRGQCAPRGRHLRLLRRRDARTASCSAMRE